MERSLEDGKAWTLSFGNQVEKLRMDVAVAFGRAVKMRRAELDLSQEDVTGLTGLARSFLSGVECGRKKPTLDSVWRMAMALRCHPSDLWRVAERILDEHGANPIALNERHLHGSEKL